MPFFYVDLFKCFQNLPFHVRFSLGRPPNPQLGEENHLYQLTTFYLEVLQIAPLHRVSRITLSATLKDLSATSKSRENTDIRQSFPSQILLAVSGGNELAYTCKPLMVMCASYYFFLYFKITNSICRNRNFKKASVPNRNHLYWQCQFNTENYLPISFQVKLHGVFDNVNLTLRIIYICL